MIYQYICIDLLLLIKALPLKTVIVYALVPVPNLKANINWHTSGNAFKDHVIKILSDKILFDLDNNIVEDFICHLRAFKIIIYLIRVVAFL